MKEYLAVYQENGKIYLAQNVWVGEDKEEDSSYGPYKRQVVSLDFDQIGEVYQYIVKHFIEPLFVEELDKNA